MGTRYHIKDNGEPAICTAHVRDCPLGENAPHFPNKTLAREHYERSMELSDAIAPLKKQKPLPMRVYRAGSMETMKKEESFEDLNNTIALFDARAPKGRQTRSGALFASPDLKSHSRWVGCNGQGSASMNSHEILVDANSVFIYNVNAYEDASLYVGKERLEHVRDRLIDDYWASGMTLAQWHQLPEEEKGDPGTWEILLPSDMKYKTKKVSNKTVITEAMPDRMNGLNFMLEWKRAREGLMWRKSTLLPEQYHEAGTQAMQKGLDGSFVSTMQKIHQDNAYTKEDVYYAEKEIYRKYRTLQGKKGKELPNYSQLSQQDKSEFRSNVETYMEIAQSLTLIGWESGQVFSPTDESSSLKV